MDNLENIQNRQEKVIGQGMLTNSKGRKAFSETCPTHIISGINCYVTTSTNETMVDMICGLGAMSIGYGEPSIQSELMKQLMKGVSFSLPTPYEVDAAEFLLSEFLPKYDAVKYLKTGAEATSAAVRIARSATGREWIWTVGYHGWHDMWISTKASPKGLAEEFKILELSDLDTVLNNLEGSQSETAAVIIEPIMLDHSEENTKKLRSLVSKCRELGILTIFDEIVCGTRIPEVFISNNLEPDLVCIGKGIANGLPLSGVVGKKHLMHETPYFVSSTFAGDALSLVSHLHTLKYLKNNPVKNLYEAANRTMATVKEKLSPWVELKGYGTRGFFTGQFDLVQQELAKTKILIGKSWFMNYSHVPIAPLILSAIDDAVSKLPTAKLEGRPTEVPFKRI